MSSYRGLVRTDRQEMMDLCRASGLQSDIAMTICSDISSFLLELQQDDFQVLVFDCGRLKENSVSWVKFIRRLRPKLPLVVLADDINATSSAKMYEEKVFYIAQEPIDATAFRKVLAATIKSMMA